MSGEYLQASFFQNKNPLISRLVETWPNGKLTTARGGGVINTVATTGALTIGKVEVLPLEDDAGVLTYVIQRVERGIGAAGLGKHEKVGAFLAFQATNMMFEWAREIDHMQGFQLAIQAPPGYAWSSFVGLMEFKMTITIPLSGGNIEMPGRRY